MRPQKGVKRSKMDTGCIKITTPTEIASHNAESKAKLTCK